MSVVSLYAVVVSVVSLYAVVVSVVSLYAVSVSVMYNVITVKHYMAFNYILINITYTCVLFIIHNVQPNVYSSKYVV